MALIVSLLSHMKHISVDGETVYKACIHALILLAYCSKSRQ